MPIPCELRDCAGISSGRRRSDFCTLTPVGDLRGRQTEDATHAARHVARMRESRFHCDFSAAAPAFHQAHAHASTRRSRTKRRSGMPLARLNNGLKCERLKPVIEMARAGTLADATAKWLTDKALARSTFGAPADHCSAIRVSCVYARRQRPSCRVQTCAIRSRRSLCSPFSVQLSRTTPARSAASFQTLWTGCCSS